MITTANLKTSPQNPQENPQHRTPYPSVLDEVYFSNYDELEAKTEMIRNLYDLKQIDFRAEVNDRRFYDYTTITSSFLSLVLYSSSKKIWLLVATNGSNGLEYSLPHCKLNPQSPIEIAINKLTGET